MLGLVYDKATHHCDDCGWDGTGWELKGNFCPKCNGKNVKEIDVD